jgi:hypothetical protein
MCRRALALGLLLLTGSRPAEGQALEAGTRVRVSAARPPLSKEVGTLVARRGDTLLIQRRRNRWSGSVGTGLPNVDTVRVAWSAVRQLDVWQGRSHGRGALKGFLYGFGTALAVSGGLVLATRKASDEGLWMIAVPVYTGAGAVMGTLIGAAVGSARWRRVRP